MSKVYVNFKKSKKDEIEETFHLLRYHYSEIIERIKKKKNCGFIFILDDIFLRVFKWVDKKPQSNTDSILLRNAFSHFNIVYDEQSLNDAGPVFEKMFLKSNTYENFENFKNGLLDQGYSDVNQRIILYNIKDKDSLEADAMLDTNVYQVCRYFMTFCHCLYAIFSNQLYDVPFSQTLLEQFSETYGLKLQGNSSKSFTMKGIKIKNCTINTQTEVTEVTEERELDQTNNLSITSNDDKNMVFTLTTFCNLTVHAKGTEVYLDNKLLETGQAQTLFSGAVSIKSKSFQIEDGILRIENGRIETKPIKQDDYILIVEEGGELNIRGGSITIFPNTNSTFSVQVRGVNEKDGAKNVITTIFGLGTISCNKYPITFSKSLFGETSKCYGNLRVETGSHVTVCNPTLLTIKCTKGSVKVYTIKGYDMNENDDYIRFYTHKTNYMEDNMNQKLIAISPQKLKPSPSITTTKSPAQSHKLKK
ncbi:hypothetical protein RB653_003476 [Dictyostelium firmibasis]|uniref:Uncharacterized protein n=1 Tax=Dictyostelium firmibasis TaxID=79012 RepID=A0AAN7YVT9_9MYCE